VELREGAGNMNLSGETEGGRNKTSLTKHKCRGKIKNFKMAAANH
jgi:hypothetical protein